MQFLYDSNTTISLSLYMEGHFINNSDSSNVMAEITGSESPHEVVVIGVCSNHSVKLDSEVLFRAILTRGMLAKVQW